MMIFLLKILADKYLNDWIKKLIGEKYAIKLLDIYNSFIHIIFNLLSNQYIIKKSLY